MSATPPRHSPGDPIGRVRWPLLAGNFVIGCGVMVVPGTLPDLTADLGVSIPVGGQLIAVAAVMMGCGAPLLAGLVARWDRRRLLALALAWYALGHTLCALAPHYAALLPLRALTVLSAAVFTPQAAAAAGFLAGPRTRGQAITFVFLGWSLASVVGLPLTAYVGAWLGWRAAMLMVAAAAAATAWWVWRATPVGIRPPALSLRAWHGALTNPALIGVVAVTALQSSGQYTLLAYATPYFREVLHASPAQVSVLFGWMGALGLAGNLLLNRHVDRIGPARAVGITLTLVILGQLAWPLASTATWMMLAIAPWSLGGFATNSAQQARLGGLAPDLTPALMALNTSAIYLGHAIGASSGGALIAARGYGPLHSVALMWLVAAWLLSQLAQRWARQRGLSKKT